MENTNIKFWLSFDQLETLVLRGLASPSEEEAFHQLEKSSNSQTYVYA